MDAISCFKQIAEWKSGKRENFYHSLIEAISKSESLNLIKLKKGYPNLIRAWQRYEASVDKNQFLHDELVDYGYPIAELLEGLKQENKTSRKSKRKSAP